MGHIPPILCTCWGIPPVFCTKSWAARPSTHANACYCSRTCFINPLFGPHLNNTDTGIYTAGQERFRSITKLYYRGASAVLLVYSIIDESSFEEMGRWLTEMRENLGNDIIIHVIGTKSDVVAQEPSSRKIPFERCIAYVADNLYPQKASTPTVPSGSTRSSGFWGQEIGTSLQSDNSPISLP